MYHFPFQKRHEVNAVELTSIQSFLPLGVDAPFAFQLHTKG